MALRRFLNNVHLSKKRPLYPYLFSSMRNYTSGMNAVTSKVVDFDTIKSKVISQDIILIDVREPQELKEEGKIPYSVNIPQGRIVEAFTLTGTEFQNRYGVNKPSLDSDSVVLSCRSGKRATDAFQKLFVLGYENISVYKGSFLDWIKNGGPIEK